MRELTREQFFREFKNLWTQGQHVTIVGTTGSGKTVLAESLYEMRKYCVVVATKKADESLDAYGESFKRIKKWPPNWHQKHVLFWFKPKELGDFSEQRQQIYNVLSDVYMVGGWTVGLDDVFFIADTLQMKSTLQMLYTQVRSHKVSIVGNIQRPAWVPLEVLNQASHVLIFGLKDENDVEKVGKEQGVKVVLLKRAIEALKDYDFVWIRQRKEPVIVRS